MQLRFSKNIRAGIITTGILSETRFQDAQSGHEVLNGSVRVLLSAQRERSATGRDMELLIGFWIMVLLYTYTLLAIKA